MPQQQQSQRPQIALPNTPAAQKLVEEKQRQQLEAQQQKQQEIYCRDAELTTAMHIFAQLVALRVSQVDPTIGQGISPQQMRAAAHDAKLFAPFLLEAYGLVTYNVEEHDNDTDD